MKELIIKALEELQQAFNIEQPVMNRLQVLTPQEFSDAENTTVRDSFETWGKYNIAILYSGFPDYYFFDDENETLEEIKRDLTTWMRWCNIIQ